MGQDVGNSVWEPVSLPCPDQHRQSQYGPTGVRPPQVLIVDEVFVEVARDKGDASIWLGSLHALISKGEARELHWTPRPRSPVQLDGRLGDEGLGQSPFGRSRGGHW